MSNPPQHLLGGLNVALLVCETSNPDQVLATRHTLEELGVNVVLVSARRGRPADPHAAGDAAALEVSLTLANADPDALDGVVVLSDAAGARRLRGEPHAREFLQRIDQENKPVAAVTDGVLLLATHGASQPRTVSAPEPLSAKLQRAGAPTSNAPLTVDGNWLSAARADVLPEFHVRLKEMLANRRLETITLGNDQPSAVGEDG